MKYISSFKSLLLLVNIFFIISCTPKEEKSKLMASDWKLIKVNNELPKEGGYGISFKEDEVMGITNCNYISGEYSLTKKTITIKNSGMTEMACGGNNYEFESFYFMTLSGKFNYSLVDDHLLLKNDQISLEYKRIE